MFGWLKRKVEKAYDKKVNSIGLALFRITYFTVFFFEILQFRYFRHLIFDYIPYFQEYEINFGPILGIWLLIIFLLIIGLFTRIAAVINYILTLTFLAAIHTYEYHVFYAYVGLNFLMIFMPVNNSISVDRILLRVRYSTSKFTYTPTTKVSVLSYYIPLFIGIAIVYFDSIFFKASSGFWMKGLGMWRPAVLPQFNHFGISILLNNKWLSLALGYITLIFETILIFLFWYKPFRWPFVIIGWGLHIGILIFFPIPWFALTVIFLYFLLIPIGTWQKIARLIKSKKPSFTFIYDGDCPLCNRTKIIISSFDVFNKIKFRTITDAQSTNPLISKISTTDLAENVYSISEKNKIYKGVDTYIQVFLRMIYLAPVGLLLLIPGIYHLSKWIYQSIAQRRKRNECTDESCAVGFAVPQNIDDKAIFHQYTIKKLKVSAISYFILFVIFMQLCVSYNSGVVSTFRKKIGIDNTFLGMAVSKYTNKIEDCSKLFFGITGHAVFMDGHINGYNHIVAIQHISSSGEKTWLPIVNEKGNPSWYLYGFNWVHWTFRVNGPSINTLELEKGIRDFTAFWMHKVKKQEGTQKFIILIKKIDVPQQWEKNFLEKQMEKPWIEVGYANWINKQFTFYLCKDIENM